MGKCTTLNLTNDSNGNLGAIKATSLSTGASGSETQITATAAELNASSDTSLNTSRMTVSAAISGAQSVATQVSTHRYGNIVETTMYIDLTGLKGTTTDNDIIGDTGASHFGQITTAVNGVIFAGEVHCAEVPTTGPDDINLSCASVDTGAYDADVTGLTNYAALMTSGGAHAIGTVKPFTALPTADYYLYLSSGEAGTAGTYDAGILIIKMWGLTT